MYFCAEINVFLCSREVVTLQGDHYHFIEGQMASYKVINVTL